MKSRVWNPFSHRSVGVGIRTRHEERVAGRHDAFSDRSDLLGGLSRPENDLRKALPGAPVVIDAGKAKILERSLAQILKESVLRRLRCYDAAANLFEEGLEFVARHAGRKRSRASKCLTRVDFQFC
jgi:hypothetical protein